MWYDYKDELSALGYTMIEYDWLILDNITFTIEGTYDFASCYVYVFDGVSLLVFCSCCVDLLDWARLGLTLSKLLLYDTRTQCA